jgi:hypothetical protein
METAILFVIGIVIGFVVSEILSRKDSMGTIRVDSSDPYDGPYLFLEMTGSVEKLKKRKYAMFKVSTISYIPHE